MPAIKANGARFLAWYSDLFKRGGKWIAIALLIPCCGLSVMYGGAQQLGLIETPPTSTPRPTATPAPTRTPRPPATARPTRATPTDAPIDPPPTETPARIQPAMQAPPPVAPTAAPPAEAQNPRPDRDPTAGVNCGDFATRAEARAWWQYWRARGVQNPGGLDGNNDGTACEGAFP